MRLLFRSWQTGARHVANRLPGRGRWQKRVGFRWRPANGDRRRISVGSPAALLQRLLPIASVGSAVGGVFSASGGSEVSRTRIAAWSRPSQFPEASERGNQRAAAPPDRRAAQPRHIWSVDPTRAPDTFRLCVRPTADRSAIAPRSAVAPVRRSQRCRLVTAACHIFNRRNCQISPALTVPTPPLPSPSTSPRPRCSFDGVAPYRSPRTGPRFTGPSFTGPSFTGPRSPVPAHRSPVHGSPDIASP
jgi:hypothetical protein